MCLLARCGPCTTGLPPSTKAITSKDHDDHDDCGVSDDDDNVNEEDVGNDDREVLCEVEPIAGVAITSMKIFMKRTSALERYKTEGICMLLLDSVPNSWHPQCQCQKSLFANRIVKRV